MRFLNYSILFLLTICTVSQRFWNRVCTSSHDICDCVLHGTVCVMNVPGIWKTRLFLNHSFGSAAHMGTSNKLAACSALLWNLSAWASQLV